MIEWCVGQETPSEEGGRKEVLNLFESGGVAEVHIMPCPKGQHGLKNPKLQKKSIGVPATDAIGMVRITQTMGRVNSNVINDGQEMLLLPCE